MSELTPSKSSPNPHPPAPSVTYTNGNIIIDGLPPATRSKSYLELADCKLMSIVHSYKHLLTHGTRAGKRASEKMKRKGMPLDNEIFQVPVAYTFITIPRIVTPTATSSQAIPYGTIDDEAVIMYAPTEIDSKDTSHGHLNETATSHSIVITIVINSAYKPIIRTQGSHQSGNSIEAGPKIPEGFREMTAQEVREHIDYYGQQCAQEIQAYLLDVHNAAVRAGTTPDYFQ